MEIRDRRRRRRGRCVEGKLIGNSAKSATFPDLCNQPRPDQSWQIQVSDPKLDRGSDAVTNCGIVLLSLGRNASGIMVQPPSAATVCELEPLRREGVWCRGAEDC